MDAIDFFNHDDLELPRPRDTDDFEGFIDALYQTFLGHVATLTTPDYVTQTIAANRPLISTLCDRIKGAINFSLRGLPHRAFEDIDLAIQGVRPHFDRLCTPQNVAQTPALNQLYRIRTGGPAGARYSKPDLFHIPFEKRHLVKRQRYSLPGLPCLYLGGTLYVCWEELGRPSFDSIVFSRFRLTRQAHVTFLDFGYRPALMAAMINANRASCQQQSKRADFAVAQGVCWPIIAACSIRRRHADAPFIHEYIVPQLVLQWIAHSGAHDGIRYFSVNIDDYVDSPAMVCNYVFPARQHASARHCPALRATFEMSEPISWQIFQQMGQPPGVPAAFPLHSSVNVALVAGTPSNYIHTPFGAMEAKTINLPTAIF